MGNSTWRAAAKIRSTGHGDDVDAGRGDQAAGCAAGMFPISATEARRATMTYSEFDKLDRLRESLRYYDVDANVFTGFTLILSR